MGLVLVSANCFSQGFLKRFSFGLKAGGNFSNFTNADFDTEGMAGFHAGALVNFKITDKLSVQEEFLFSSQGVKFKDDVFGKDNIKINYMTVPLMLKYRTNPGIFFEAGPQIGFRISEDTDNMTIKEFSKKLEYGVAGGLGYQSKSGFGISARYIAGLSDVGDFKLSNVKTDFRNNTIQASIFYIF